MNINFYLKRLTVNHICAIIIFSTARIFSIYAMNILVHNIHQMQPQAKYIIKSFMQ